MTDINKIADKIQKLLNLSSNNPYEGEAQAALLKAQKLMAQYNIEMSQLDPTAKAVEYSLEQTKVKANPRNNILGNIIANSFSCKGILFDGKWAFFGRKDNAIAAASAMKFMHKTMEAGMRRICREHGLETTQAGACVYYNPYANGFLTGLKEATDAQCKALAIVLTQDVKDEFNKKFPKTNQYRGKGMQYQHDAHAYAEGKADGRNAMNRRSLEAGA